MISPYKGAFKVTQPFKGSIHDGLDLVGLDSKEVRSTVNGTVEWAYWENAADKKQGFGLYVRIKQNGSTDKHYFGHLSALKIKPGQDVKAGDVIGIEGSTGKSTGSHVHYCIRGNGSKSLIRDVNAFTGIPNKTGIYNASTEPIPDVVYQVYANGKWLPRVTGDSDYAGFSGSKISGIKVGATYGTIKYRAHTVNGKWYPWVSNMKDYAGVINKPIDAVKAKLTGAKGYVLQTRVSPVGELYYSWVTNDSDYAGSYGKAIDRLQMRIVKK